MLRREGSHLVYFYCHGGLTTDETPYIKVGAQGQEGRISHVNLEDCLWTQPRPLVFINGCHTAALDPEHAFDLLTRFVYMNAAGVIGTEITIFESLAVTFAEECLGHFLTGKPIGDAVRLARLKLLQDGNPLGLVYNPYAVASLTMSKIPLTIPSHAHR